VFDLAERLESITEMLAPSSVRESRWSWK